MTRILVLVATLGVSTPVASSKVLPQWKREAKYCSAMGTPESNDCVVRALARRKAAVVVLDCANGKQVPIWIRIVGELVETDPKDGDEACR